jgi:hypothetical protein
MRRPGLFVPALLLTLLALLPSGSRAGHEAPREGWRVTYVFDPADRGQLQRAAAAHAGADGRPDIDWVGIRRSSAPASFAPLKLTQLPETTGLTPTARDWLREVAASSTQDRVLLESAVGAWEGPGADLPRLALQAGLSADVATDVGVTTWGKVKDLFR